MNEKSAIINYVYSSQFAPYITAFVEEKRGMGHKYNANGGILRLFDRFVTDNGFSDTVITKELLETWSIKRQDESDKTHKSRFYAVQNLSKYMARLGHNSYISAIKFSKSKGQFRPYIFTDDEIDSFLTCASGLTYTARTTKRHIALPMLFTVLACSGLRLNEVLKLKKCDITFFGENTILRIHDAKFDKDRIVPLSAEISAAFAEYMNKAELLYPNSEYVFPARDNGKYSLNAIYYNFRNILWEAGISHGGRGNGPRIHDLRHTFAVKSLRKMALDGTDTPAALPLLCKYMGHKNIESTQTYITLTAEMFPYITEAIETACGNIIPAPEVMA